MYFNSWKWLVGVKIPYWDDEGMDSHVRKSFCVMSWQHQLSKDSGKLAMNCSISNPPFDGPVIGCVNYKLICEWIKFRNCLDALNI